MQLTEPRPPRGGALARTLSRVARLGPEYQLELEPAGDRWEAARELVVGGRLFDRALERSGVEPGDLIRRRVLGSQLLLRYARLSWPALAACTLERRAPDVDLDNVLVRIGTDGYPEAFALAQPRFAALAGDPAAHDPAAVAVPAVAEALLEWLRSRLLHGHLDVLVQTVRDRLHTSGSTLWANVADALATPLLWHAQFVAADPARAVADARAVLAWAPSQRLEERVALTHLQEDGIGQDGSGCVVHVRRTCCLASTLPATEPCVDCPLVRRLDPTEAVRARYEEALVRRGRVLSGGSSGREGPADPER